MSRIGHLANTFWNGLKTRRQVEVLGPAAAADFGVTLADVGAVAHQPGDVPDRMQRMAAVFGAEDALAKADRYSLQDMAHNCADCAARGVCARVLYRAQGPEVGEVDFCPNAPAYREMAAVGQAA